MPEESPLVRQWILLRTLSSRHYGATIKELAEEMAVSEKTIRRYLQTFQEAGFPLVEVEGEFGRKTWRLTRDKNQPPLSFTFDEAVALHLGQRCWPALRSGTRHRGHPRRSSPRWVTVPKHGTRDAPQEGASGPLYTSRGAVRRPRDFVHLRVNTLQESASMGPRRFGPWRKRIPGVDGERQNLETRALLPSKRVNEAPLCPDSFLLVDAVTFPYEPEVES